MEEDFESQTAAIGDAVVIQSIHVESDSVLENVIRSTRLILEQTDPSKYVSTVSERCALRTLKQFGCILITGKSGTGKSRLGLTLLDEISRESKRTPVVLTSSYQWDLIPKGTRKKPGKNEKKYVVMIDDIFGSSYLMQSRLDDWERMFDIMWPVVETGAVWLVMTSRGEIVTQINMRLKRYTLMKKSKIVNLDSKEYCLVDSEKENIFLKYCGQTLNVSKRDLRRIVQTQSVIGFPQCCYYFASNKQVQTSGINFFKNPLEMIISEVNLMAECDSISYFVLLLVFMHEGSLDITCLKPSKVTQEFKNLRSNLCESCGLRNPPSCREIEDKIISLCGVYFAKCDERIQFQHQSVFDAVFLFATRQYAEMCIKVCPSRMLVELVRTEETESSLTLHLNFEDYGLLADRILHLLSEGNKDIVDHPCLGHKRFIEFLKVQKNTEIIRILSSCFTEPNTVWYVDMLYAPIVYRTNRRKVLFQCNSVAAVLVLKMLTDLVITFWPEVVNVMNCSLMSQILCASIYVGSTHLIRLLQMANAEFDESCAKALCWVTLFDNSLFKTIDWVSYIAVDDLPSILCMSVLRGNSYCVKLLLSKVTESNSDVETSVFGDCLLQLFKEMSNATSSRLIQSVSKDSYHDITCNLLTTDAKLDKDILLYLAAGQSNPFALKLILPLDVNVDCVINHTGLSPVHEASRFGSFGCLSELIHHGASVWKTPANSGQTCLHFAAMSDVDAEKKILFILETMSSCYAVADITNRHGDTPLHVASKYGNISVIRTLIRQKADVTKVNKKGQTPLHLAVDFGDVTLVQMLLKSNLSIRDMRDKDGNTALSCAVRMGNYVIAKALVSAGANIYYVDDKRRSVAHIALLYQHFENTSFGQYALHCINHLDEYGETLLLLACKHGKHESIMSLLANGSNVDITNNKGETVLHKAAESQLDTSEKIKHLVKIRPSLIDAKEKDGRTALFVAVENENIEAVTFLLEKKANVNVGDINGRQPLMLACEHGYSSVVKLLLSWGADPNGVDNTGNTALHMQSLYTEDVSSEIIEILIAKDGNVNRKNKSHEVPLHIAIMTEGRLHICLRSQLLLKHGADPTVTNGNHLPPLHIALETGNRSMIELLLDGGRDSNIKDHLGRTVLHFMLDAVTLKHDFTALFMKNGVDPNKRDRKGRTALHIAAEKEHHNAIIELIKGGADTNITNLKGRTPFQVSKSQYDVIGCFLLQDKSHCINDEGSWTILNLSVEKGNSRILQLLIDGGIEPSVQDDIGQTALHLAARLKQNECMAVLLQNGSDQNIRDCMGKTALHLAADAGNIYGLELLLGSGIDTSTKDNYGRTPLHYAVQQMNTQGTMLLLNTTSNCNVKDLQGKTALHLAAEAGNDGSIALLLTHGAVTDIQDLEGKTALHTVTEQGITDTLSLLLEKTDNVNIRDSHGRTALHLAALNARHDMTKLLIDRSADTNLQDENGLTALHIASANVHNTLIPMLLENSTDTNIQNQFGKTALHIAAETGNSKAVASILRSGADPILPDNEGKTALHLAAQHWIGACAEIIVKDISDPNVQDHTGKTALHLAIEEIGSFGLGNAEILLNRGLNPNIQDHHGRTVLHECAEKLNIQLFNLLIRKGANPALRDSAGRAAIHIVVGAKDKRWLTDDDMLVILNSLLEKGIDPSVQDQTGKTALHIAAETGTPKCMARLLEGGAILNLQDNDGNTALHLAAESDHSKCSAVLLDWKADDNIRNKQGCTAFQVAKGRGSVLITTLLQSVDVIHGEAMTISAFQIAEERHDIRSLKLLLQKGCDPNVRDKNGFTTLHLAAKHANSDSMALWLNMHTNPNIQDSEGRTPLHILALTRERPLECFELMLSKGANPNIQDVEGKTALHIQAERWKQLIPDLHSKAGINFYVKGYKDIDKYMHSLGMWNAVPEWLYPVMGLGAIQKNVEALVKHGGDISIPDNGGQTVVDIIQSTHDLCFLANGFIEKLQKERSVYCKSGHSNFSTSSSSSFISTKLREWRKWMLKN